ncbi:helix-turn-helix domain-containing protein [Nocardia sp. NPDC050697]|uniref:TetR/AcrR family transcriptional regulator n=1 Tax=Nocardia sp. NPDC050697 TaxID=3155158 RepID=UPI0033F54F58
MSGDDDVDRDGRRQRTRRSRTALSRAAFDLLVERGLAGVAVEDIAGRAGVTRRTFSRHFASIEDAVLGDIDRDVDVFNAALRDRPLLEPPLLAYRNAVDAWLAAAGRADGGDVPLWTRRWVVFRRFDSEPRLFTGYQRIRLSGQRAAVEILADRLGVDPAVDRRPAAAVAAGSGVLLAAFQTWAIGDDPDALPRLVGEFFDAHLLLVAGAASVIPEESLT